MNEMKLLFFSVVTLPDSVTKPPTMPRFQSRPDDAERRKNAGTRAAEHSPERSDWRVLPVIWCSAEYQAAIELRHRVLRAPLGLTFTADELDAEAEQRHFAGLLERQLIATVSVTQLPEGGVKLRQMVVDPDFQRRGWGRALLQEVERQLAEHGHRKLSLHARETAVGFYAAAGYLHEGETFEEVGLPHRRMIKEF